MKSNQQPLDHSPGLPNELFQLIWWAGFDFNSYCLVLYLATSGHTCVIYYKYFIIKLKERVLK